MTALEVGSPAEPQRRLWHLLDHGSMAVRHEPDGVAVTAAEGRIEGVPVLAFCTDATRKGGSLGLRECVRIADTIAAAVRRTTPVLGLWHSGGAKLADGIESMHGIGLIFAAMVRASGRVPQLSVVLGPAAGGAAYGTALTDLVVMAPDARIFVTGPDVVRKVTGETIDIASLGGPDAHGPKSGVAHVVAHSEIDALHQARRLTALLACRQSFTPEAIGGPFDLRALLPESSRRAYDVRPLLHRLVDGEEFFELQPAWAPNICTGLGRLGGATVGVLANNPIRKGGCLDSLSAEKAARFVRMCDALGIPLLVVVDVPGYLPGVTQEWGGVVRRGAKLLHAFADAQVARVTLVTRKSYGGAYIAMNSRALGATAVFAWPGAEVAVMGAESAVEIVHRQRLQAAADGERDALRARLVQEQLRNAGGVERGLALGLIDEVVDPRWTRHRLANAFAEACASAPAVRAGYRNIPL